MSASACLNIYAGTGMVSLTDASKTVLWWYVREVHEEIVERTIVTGFDQDRLILVLFFAFNSSFASPLCSDSGG